MAVFKMNYWKHSKTTTIGILTTKWDKDAHQPFFMCFRNAFLPHCIQMKQNFQKRTVIKSKYSNLLSLENELLLCLKLPTAPKQICDSKQTHLSH